MSRWSAVLSRALVSLGQAAYPLGYPGAARLEGAESAWKPIELSSPVSVDEPFWSIVDYAWGRPGSARTVGRRRRTGNDGPRSIPLFTFWPFFL